MIEATALRLLYIKTKLRTDRLLKEENLSTEVYEAIDKQEAKLNGWTCLNHVPKEVIDIWDLEVELLKQDPGSWFLYFQTT